MNHLITCKCGDAIVKSQSDETKVRAKIVVFRDDKAYAICKSCDAEVEIPLRIDEVMLKSMSSTSRHAPRLYIKNMSKSS